MAEPVIEPRRKGRNGTQLMLIPSREMVSTELRKLPLGLVTDREVVRRNLAAEFGADACCPVTLQRHLIAISAVDDAPFWRVIDPDRPFARRIIGGPDGVRAQLAEEQGRRQQ